MNCSPAKLATDSNDKIRNDSNFLIDPPLYVFKI